MMDNTHNHRRLQYEDSPTNILPDGTQQWHYNGKLHRDTGPAVYNPNTGTMVWYYHGQIHREDGPAMIRPNDTTMWFIHHKLHREDGPAIMSCSTGNSWYLNNQLCSFDEYCDIMMFSNKKRFLLKLKY